MEWIQLKKHPGFLNFFRNDWSYGDKPCHISIRAYAEPHSTTVTQASGTETVNKQNIDVLPQIQAPVLKFYIVVAKIFIVTLSGHFRFVWNLFIPAGGPIETMSIFRGSNILLPRTHFFRFLCIFLGSSGLLGACTHKNRMSCIQKYAWSKNSQYPIAAIRDASKYEITGVICIEEAIA